MPAIHKLWQDDLLLLVELAGLPTNTQITKLVENRTGLVANIIRRSSGQTATVILKSLEPLMQAIEQGQKWIPVEWLACPGCNRLLLLHVSYPNTSKRGVRIKNGKAEVFELSQPECPYCNSSLAATLADLVRLEA